MTAEIDKPVDTLTQRFLLDHPMLAAQQIDL